MRRPTTARTAAVAATVLAVAVAALVAAPSAGAAGRIATVATPPSATNGLIAYSCLGAAGVAGRDGWVLSTTSGPYGSGFQPWGYGRFFGGVGWAPDGSEMVHDALMSAPNPVSGHTVFLSEQDGSYPWLATDYQHLGGLYDTDTTFTADGQQVLFTRHTATTSTVEAIAAAGEDPPEPLSQPAGLNSQPAASSLGDIAFVNVAASGPTAGIPYVWLLASGSDIPAELGPGTRPEFSPDGSRIAFVTSGGTLATMATDGSGVTAAGPASYPGPINDFAWSPDGTTFLVGVGVGSGGLYTAPVAAGSTLTSIPTYFCSTRATQVSWQPIPDDPDDVVRVWGSTRENTAIAVSDASFPTDHTADAVVLADSYHFPDGLSGTPLATHVNGPLLLTPGTATTVLPAVMAEIKRVLKPGSTQVYVLGGTGSVSAGIATDLQTNGLTVTRLWGPTRYETSLAIANAMGHGATAPHQIFLATGTDFPDGLSAGAAAASYWPGGGGVVLLTNGATLPTATKAYIDDALAHEDPNDPVVVTTVGGLADQAYAGTAKDPKISCVGADRYATSACVALVHFGATPNVTLATGTSFPDALSGGAYAGRIGAPLLLAPPTLDSTNASPYFLHAVSGAVSSAYVFGGVGVVSLTQFTQLLQIIGDNTVADEITPTTPLTAHSRVLARPTRRTDGGPTARTVPSPFAHTA